MDIYGLTTTGDLVTDAMARIDAERAHREQRNRERDAILLARFDSCGEGCTCRGSADTSTRADYPSRVAVA